jgi:flagellar secretion chaperone FliS
MSGQDDYLETEVLTATPYRLHLLTLDGAIRFARQASAALERSNFEAAHAALNASRGLVGELIGGLDESHAPELVPTLKAVFVFAYRNLALADIEHQTGKIHAAIRVLSLHRETWVALHERLLEEQAGQPQEAAETAVPAAIDQSGGRSWVG